MFCMPGFVSMGFEFALPVDVPFLLFFNNAGHI